MSDWVCFKDRYPTIDDCSSVRIYGAIDQAVEVCVPLASARMFLGAQDIKGTVSALRAPFWYWRRCTPYPDESST